MEALEVSSARGNILRGFPPKQIVRLLARIRVLGPVPHLVVGGAIKRDAERM